MSNLSDYLRHSLSDMRSAITATMNLEMSWNPDIALPNFTSITIINMSRSWHKNDHWSGNYSGFIGEKK